MDEPLKVFLNEHWDLIQRVSSDEHAKLPEGKVLLDELIQIAVIAGKVLFENNDRDALSKTYLASAIRYAIRKELDIRYPWYTFQDSPDLGPLSRFRVREAIYETILSLFDEDKTAQPASPYSREEQEEIHKLFEVIIDTIDNLPNKERRILHDKLVKRRPSADIARDYEIPESEIKHILLKGFDQFRFEIREETED